MIRLVSRPPCYLCAFYDGIQVQSIGLLSRRRIQEEIPCDPTCFPLSLLFVCFLRRHTSPIDWFTVSIDIDIIKRYVINTITATSIQIKIRAQGPTPSYGTESTAGPFLLFRTKSVAGG